MNGDTTFERDETLMLDLSNASGAPIGDVQGIGTIVNDDAAPGLSVANASVVEGNAGRHSSTSPCLWPEPPTIAASVDYATAGTTATAGSDFVAAAGTLTIPAGATTGTVDVVVNGDVTYESNETLSLMLSNPADATIGDGTAQGTIRERRQGADDAHRCGSCASRRAVIAKGLLEPATSGAAGHRDPVPQEGTEVREGRREDGPGAIHQGP